MVWKPAFLNFKPNVEYLKNSDYNKERYRTANSGQDKYFNDFYAFFIERELYFFEIISCYIACEYSESIVQHSNFWQCYTEAISWITKAFVKGTREKVSGIFVDIFGKTTMLGFLY